MPDLILDHLVIVAPSLEAGVSYVRDQTGIEMSAGGRHPEMGTHNRLLRLDTDIFLEVIAIDPEAPRPERPRWFGLDDVDAVQSAWDEGRRLRTWVARTTDLAAVLTDHIGLLGRATRVSRGDRSWLFSLREDGSLPADGAVPAAIDWGAEGSPAPGMPDLGARLVSFSIEHPDPARLKDLFRILGIDDPPQVHRGPALTFRALIETPSGVKRLV